VQGCQTDKPDVSPSPDSSDSSDDEVPEENPTNISLEDKNSKECDDKLEDDSNLLIMPENSSDDGIGISEIPIMKVSSDEKTTKPIGSAYIYIQMSIGKSNRKVDASVCIDTGADITLCDSAFLIAHFGEKALRHVIVMSKPPKLRSASGHCLKILGKVKTILFLGEYEIKTHVIVHEGKANIFLLGSDTFYNRLIFDRGMFLAFADKKYPPIPIRYEISKGAVKAICEYQVAPRSNALIQVKIVNSAQFAGKEVVLSPLNEGEHKHLNILDEAQCAECLLNPVRNTVSTIDSNGNSLMLIHNDTDDILTIKPDTVIANADLITSDMNNVNQVIIDSESDMPEFVSKQLDEPWPVSALKGELKERLPSNVIVQWDNIVGKATNDNVDNQHHNINYVHDKEERKNLLDGTGEGFPTPPAADPENPEINTDLDSESWLENVEHSHLSDSQWDKLRLVLIKYRDAFSKSKTEIGCCNYFKVDLPLKPGTGYLYNKPRPLPFKHREIAAETISELLAKGVIRPSKSPHATNIVCVKKKTMNGVVSYRVCCDLRQVNEHSVPNRFPNFWIEDAMGKIQGAAYRSALDFKDAFHMLVLTEESIPVTAFYFNNVLFEYVRVPFGHVCAMNAFCCLMALLCVGYDSSSYYADDLMITTKADHAKTHDQLFELHLEHIGGMLARIIDAGLKLVAHKCMWGYDASRPMDWLGFTMENNLLKPQESKVKAIKEFPVPTTAKQVISFVATASFYRRFIKSFAKIAQPMYNAANVEPFVWTAEAQKSFENLKDIMCSDLVLRLPRQGEPFQLYSDASAGAIGVVLCQIDPIDKKSHPCAYGSRKFNECELKLSIPCKELLAIVYGLNLWSFYICGNPIQVFSDCRAWTFLTKQSGASGKVSRLALLISEFDISISYVKGIKNKAADGLSRAYDDGLVKYDDQITPRHPALDKLEAPELPPGEIMKLSDYLGECDKFLECHWPKILKEYETENPKGIDNLPEVIKDREQKELNPMKVNNLSSELDINKIVLEETKYVDQVIHEAMIIHADKNSTDVNRMNKYYPFQVNDDYLFEDSVILSDESELSETSDNDDLENEIKGTTDSSFKAACYNVKLVAVNETSFSLEAFAEMQQKDTFCSDKIELVRKKNNKVLEAGYFLKRKVLMRKMETADGQINNVLCIPQMLVKPLLESTHRSLLSGHFGSQRYFLNMSRKYYWPKMKEQITDFHNQCLPCQYNDKFPVKYMSGYVIRPLWPMHVVHCDLMVGLPRALDGSTAILLLYDGFSRFTYGIALTSEKADYCVKKLMSHFIAAFGLPWALHSDNGRNVDGALIRHLALMLGVIKTSTPPHTPNANPTETMCGAVAQLLRKGLNESDRRYWSLCLPFVLNALNSTVHTATGYTPNSLFFGRFKERDMVPLIPFDCESANVNEYFQKMRRFQELSFQIVRSRNERKLQAKKDLWDTNARNPPYNVGDYVLIKNNNPASGPGKMKLRAKYIGPFRVIKVYVSSLIVVPWTQNARLEEYYRDPNVFRLMHRGDIKPFHTKQVSVKHCKPFKGDIEAEEIIDPIMLSRFLDDLGVNNDAEILSEIDNESTIFNSDGPSDATSSTSSGHTPPSGGGGGNGGNGPPMPPKYDDPDPEFKDPPVESDNEEPGNKTPGYNSDTERFIDNLDISEDDKDLLRYYCQIKDEVESYRSFQSQRAFNNEECSEVLDNLKELIQSADPTVRERAEYELHKIVEDMKYVHQHETMDKFQKDYYKLAFKNDSNENESQERAVSEGTSIKSEPVHDDSNPASVQGDNVSVSNSDHFDMPDLEFDEDNQSHVSDLTWDQGPDFMQPDPNDDIPPLRANVRSPPNPGPRTPRPSIEEARRRNVRDWLEHQSPLQGEDPPEGLLTERRSKKNTPVVTRSGRISKPVAKFDSAAESRLQKETKEALKRSLAQKSEKRPPSTGTKPSRPAVTAAMSNLAKSKKTTLAESEKSKHSTVKAKTVVPSVHTKSKASSMSKRGDSASKHPTQVSKPTGANKESDDDFFD